MKKIILSAFLGLLLSVLLSAGTTAFAAGIDSVLPDRAGGCVNVKLSLNEGETASLAVKINGEDGKMLDCRLYGTTALRDLNVDFGGFPENAKAVTAVLWNGTEGMVPLCNAVTVGADDTPESTPTPEPNPFDGIKIDPETGKLIPTAYENGMVKTFEDGKEPDFEIFVSRDTGSDYTGDGSFEKPYETIRKACRDLEPGGAVRIMPGEYPGEMFGWNSSHNLFGTEEKPVWLGGVPGMERPVINGPNGCLFIAEFSYMILHDLDITGTTATSASVINITSDGKHGSDHPLGDTDPGRVAHHAVLRNIYGYGNKKSAVTLKFAWVYDVTVVDCDLTDAGAYAIDFVGGTRNTVAYNYIHDTWGVGVKMKGGSSDSDIYGNLFWALDNDGVDMGQGTGYTSFHPAYEEGVTYEADNIRTYSNIFVDVSAPIMFTAARNCYAVNNTTLWKTRQILRIFKGGGYDDTVDKEVILANGGYPHDCTVANNIFAYGLAVESQPVLLPSEEIDGKTETAFPQKDIDSFVFRNNLFYHVGNVNHRITELDIFNLVGSIVGEKLDLYDIGNDIRSEASLSFSFFPGSPGIGQGTGDPAVIPFGMRDYRGRPFKASRSVGAIEYYEEDWE